MPKYYDRFVKIWPGNATNDYHEETSLSLAVACELAYDKDLKKIQDTVEAWNYSFVGFGSVVKGADIDTQFFVMTNDENIVVVFRGSESLKDWFSDFKAVYDPGPLEKTRAHEGFQDALFPAVIKLTELIRLTKEAGSAKKLWITGHSLGGALCSLCAGMLIENGYEVYGVYTFASPRPGDGAFERELNSKVHGPHYRVVNAGDVVPHVPPEPFYSHPGKRIILEEHARQTSKESWFEQRIHALKKFVATTVESLDVADNHTLDGDNESYIPRLVRDLQRSKAV
jgi:triacylglycerol lipase